MEQIRLQKFFSDCGILSRRAAEEAIRAGQVKVNGTVAEIGQRIDPSLDTIEYRGRTVKPSTSQKHYLLLNKPRGFVTTLSDEKGRQTVADLTADLGYRVYPVGRLDMDSDGLLLLTDDGALTQRLTHPKHEIPKIYHVTVRGAVSPDALHTLRQPFLLDGYRTLPVKVTVLERSPAETVLEFTLLEGRNRQIRRMCEQTGLRITRLSRVAIGKISIGELPIGKYRHLGPVEVAYLKGEKTR